MSKPEKQKPNRLIKEKSPYLRQHAYNPVDWYPWSAQAFLKATSQDRPVFLSIGYSTCHWCHVMKRESFCDPEVAELMNETFVNIKVDREERPDLDNIYLSVCQTLTGGAGWPLTIIMTPDKKPFFAGTYFPKDSRYGRMGMTQLIPHVQDIWKNRKRKALTAADQVMSALAESIPKPGSTPGQRIISDTYEALAAQYDGRSGGFGSAPKFPSPCNLLFLLRYWKYTGKGLALEMVEKTLQSMRNGGIYDQIGSGFHRYSTDDRWLVPHFEKMLYDQAMMAIVFTEAYQATGKEEYEATAREIFTYTRREMQDEGGAFYSAEDAESDGVEGKFYIWTTSEIDSILSGSEAEVFKKVYGIKKKGNYVSEAGEETGGNIPHRAGRPQNHASALGMSADELTVTLERANEKLLTARGKRSRPHRDDKILTDWNGLMIAALAKAAAAFDDVHLAKAAERAANYLLKTMKKPGRKLMHRHRGGETAIDGYLDDYAHLAWGFLELYEATFKVRYLKAAMTINEDMHCLFWDNDSGGYFFTPTGAEPLLIRQKLISDLSVPSGNSIATMNNLRIGRVTADPRMEERVAAIGRAFSDQITQTPVSTTFMATAYLQARGPSLEVVVVGDPENEKTVEMLSALRKSYFPQMAKAFIPSNKKSTELLKLVPYAKELRPFENETTAFICIDFICRNPTTSIRSMLDILKEIEEEHRR